MNAEQKLTPPAIGQIWPGQGGIYGGIRQYPEGLCHVIYAANDVPGRHAFGDYGVKVDAESRTDGRANTKALLANEGVHHAAIAAASYTADDHKDFYLPAVGELNQGWQYAPESFAKDWYWSSSQRSANHAFLLHFEDGIQFIYVKHGECFVRPVRRLPI
ncbi:DUF1566 domain-containing protein [Pseudomonas sp. Irchel 3A18]|uniref:DUF1566 domain-containing protein n=1 Tax=Pseudomonas sp. Irchel 3A18 TaxID=2008905 RepID=UPI000BA2CB43|nr:DUF1566 domain-containing protein [Pseudomonas sp. Irchel 3A18]